MSRRRWVLTLVGLSVAWRLVRYLVGFPLWGDEAFVAVSILTRDYAGLALPLEYNQIVPVSFLWLGRGAVDVFGSSDYALRLPAVLCGLVTVPLFAILAFRMMRGRWVAAMAIAFLAAAYYPVRHATELKAYAMDLLVAVVVLLAAVRVLDAGIGVGGRRERAGWIILALVCATAVWLSYPAVFVAAGGVGTLTIVSWRRRDGRRFWAAAAVGVVLAVSFGAMWLGVGSVHAATSGVHMVSSSHWDFTFPPVREPWRLPAWFVRVHTGNMFAYPNGTNDFGSTPVFILFVIGAIALWRQAWPRALLLLAPFPLMFVAAAMEKYPYGGSARVVLHVAPSICLLAGYGTVVFLRLFQTPRQTIGVARIIFIVFAALIVIGAARDVWSPFKKFSDRENQRLLRKWGSEHQPGEQWIIFGRLGDDDGPAPDLEPWGGSAARIRANVLRYGPADVLWAPPVALLPDAGSIVLFVYLDENVDLPLFEERLAPYLDRLTERYGPPIHERNPLDDVQETLDRYVFDGASGAGS